MTVQPIAAGAKVVYGKDDLSSRPYALVRFIENVDDEIGPDAPNHDRVRFVPIVHHRPLVRKAITAYLRHCGSEQPASEKSGAVVVRGQPYVVLSSAERVVLAVYRFVGGRLKRVRRYPSALDPWQ